MRKIHVLVAAFLAVIACLGAVCSEETSQPRLTITLLNGILDEEAALYSDLVQRHSENAPIENQNWEPFSTAVVLWDESFSRIPQQLAILATQLEGASQSTRNSVSRELEDLSIRIDVLLLRQVVFQFITEPWTELYIKNANLNIAIKLNEIAGLFSRTFGRPPNQQPVWRISVVEDTKPPKTPLVSRAWRVLKTPTALAQCNDPLVPCSVRDLEQVAIDALTPDTSGFLHYEGQTFGINLGTIQDPEYSVTIRRKPGSSIQGPIRYGEPVAVIFEDLEGSSIGGRYAVIYASATDGSVDLGFTTSITSPIAYQWQLVPTWSFLMNGGVFDSRLTFALKNTVKSSNPYLTRCYAGFSVGVDLGWFLISPTETSNFNCDD